MPTKNTKYITGPRNLIINKDFCKRLRETTGLELSDKEIRTIILESNKELRNIVTESDDALRLPENLGYIVVTKYKSKKQPVDWVNTKKLGKKIPLLNLHSFNFIHHIKWFKKAESKILMKKVYKIEPCRLAKRKVAQNVKSGKVYHVWESGDFWNLEKLYKKLKKRNEHISK